MKKYNNSLEVEGLLEDEIKDNRHKKVSFEVLPMDDAFDISGSEYELDELMETLTSKEKKKRLKADKKNESFVDKINNTSSGRSGYGLDVERSFNPLTDKKYTKKYVKHEHDFAYQKVLDANKRRDKKERKNFYWIRQFLVALRSIWVGVKGVNIAVKHITDVIEKLSTYKYYSRTTRGNQAGIFDNQVVKEEKFSKIQNEEFIRRTKEHNEHINHVEDVRKSRGMEHYK